MMMHLEEMKMQLEAYKFIMDGLKDGEMSGMRAYILGKAFLNKHMVEALKCVDWLDWGAIEEIYNSKQRPDDDILNNLHERLDILCDNLNILNNNRISPKTLPLHTKIEKEIEMIWDKIEERKIQIVQHNTGISLD